MLDIVISEKYTPTLQHESYITVSSEDIAAIVYPCTSFERSILWSQLQERYGFLEKHIIESRMTVSVLVDWVHFLGEAKPISVFLWVWKIRGINVCFVEPSGDMFSYRLIEEWLRGHFSCKYDNGSRIAFFDPTNFHNCVRAIKEAIKKNKANV